MKLFKPLLATVVASGLALTAQATQITGDIDFAGEVVYDTNSLNTATMVIEWHLAIVTGTDGDFSSVALLTPVTFATPYIFNPPTQYVSPNVLWSVGGFTFELLSSTIVQQDSGFLNIHGSGIISGNGFDPTPGTWSFTSSLSSGRTAQDFSFAANNVAVPDSGSTVALLGAAFLAVAALRAKFRG